MPAAQRRRLLDDITCVCVLRKALKQKFEREQGPESAAVHGERQAADGLEVAADARKRQKEAL
jgi:hypothetical protein